jgi:hypothetical protein
MVSIWRCFSFSGLLICASLALASTGGSDTPREDVQTVIGDADATSIAVLSDAVGNIVTNHEVSDAGDNDPIFARRYPAADGQASDEPIAIDTLTDEESRLDTDAAMDAGGNFIVVWNSLPEDSSGARRLVAQRFNADLTPIGERIVLALNAHDVSDVDMNASGDFAVVWAIDNGTLNGAQVVQRFNAAGTSTSNMFTLVSNDNELISDVAIAPSGAFVVSYTADATSSDTNAHAFFQLFDAQGERVGEAVQANTDDSDLFWTAVDMEAAGNFVVAWGDGESEAVDARRFDSNGQARGDQFRVSVADGASEPQVALDASGRFVVIWAGKDEVFARRYSAEGDATEIVTVYDGQNPQDLDIAADADGDYAVIWTEVSETSPNQGVYVRRYVGPESVDLATSLVADNDSVAPGAAIGYRLTIDNNHDPVAPVDTGLSGANTLNTAIGAATGVVATITLPASLSDIAISDATAPSDRAFDCAPPDANTLTCRLEGALYAGEGVSARVLARAGDQLQTIQTMYR